MEALIIVEAVVIGLLVILVAGLLRSHAEILRQLDSLGASEHHESFVAPPRRVPGPTSGTIQSITGVTPAGATASIALSGGRGYTLLSFLSSTCAACGEFWNGSGEFGVEGVRPVVVTKGADSESPAEITRLADPARVTVMSTEAWEEFRVPSTPYFALLDNANASVVGEGSARDWNRVEDMVRRALAETRLHRNTTQRKADVDEELSAAGFEPGDPRLYGKPDHE